MDTIQDKLIDALCDMLAEYTSLSDAVLLKMRPSQSYGRINYVKAQQILNARAALLEAAK